PKYAAAPPPPPLDETAQRARDGAKAQLTERCKNVAPLSVDEQRGIVRELKDGAAPRGELTTLQAVAFVEARKAPVEQWADSEKRAVEGALYSSDPILRRSAFLVLQQSVTHPGAREALLRAGDDYLAPGRQSTFEQLLQCATLACDIRGELKGPNDPAPVRPGPLTTRFQNALGEHAPLDRIASMK
ncbi:MAG: hypothetical protein M3Z16_06750, partial [Pseudomonadota bacterium]|nr:hypothetical protein [Pseudomonadota bacterium]